jgi:hypothetical protein
MRCWEIAAVFVRLVSSVAVCMTRSSRAPHREPGQWPGKQARRGIGARTAWTGGGLCGGSQYRLSWSTAPRIYDRLPSLDNLLDVVPNAERVVLDGVG